MESDDSRSTLVSICIAYLGMLVHGFPNFFIVNGPHNAAALCNAGRCIEQNVDWIARCIEHLRGRGITQIVPTLEAEMEWTRHVYDVTDASVTTMLRGPLGGVSAGREGAPRPRVDSGRGATLPCRGESRRVEGA